MFKKKGFTLLELVIVIIILGVLAHSGHGPIHAHGRTFPRRGSQRRSRLIA